MAKLRLVLTALALLAGSSLPAAAQDGLQLVEQEIKAGLLYNFLRYTEWPQDHPIHTELINTVCVLGDDPFSGRLAPMAGRTVNQSVIEVRTVAGAADVADCSLIFIDAGEQARWMELRGAIMGESILTVSDFTGFAASGGMIEFVRVDNRIGIEVNTGAVAAAHLMVQDRILNLASVIHSESPGP
jgi:hypothetical protein